ncbi:MAG: cytochrome c [SAR324 cluster bacterium]
MKAWILLAVLLLPAALALGDESQVQLKPGAERDLVRANCTPCHSADYIPMNSVFQTRQGWEATVNKMIKALGAPVAPGDVAPIVDYLTRNYGK